MALAQYRAVRAESKFNEASNLMNEEAGAPVALAPGVRRILAGNPGLMTGAGTNTYLLGDREVAVLDPGPDDSAHLRNIRAAAGPLIRWVIVTHTHADHSPLAARLARESGAQLIGLPPPHDGRQDESFKPDEFPVDGKALTLGDIVLTAIHTPGHASNCVCYLLAAHKLLFTGDHVLGGVSPVILPPDGDMAAYIHSLDKLVAYDFERIAPGHGELMTQGKRVVELLRAHRMQREAKVLRCLASASTLDALVPAVYDDVSAERHGWARLTLQAHLIKLVRESKVSEQDGVWRVVGE
jgi:glyoxylase-like metal-dependent hydrolase (beta-lactamase superfamily II)